MHYIQDLVVSLVTAIIWKIVIFQDTCKCNVRKIISTGNKSPGTVNTTMVCGLHSYI